MSGLAIAGLVTWSVLLSVATTVVITYMRRHPR